MAPIAIVFGVLLTLLGGGLFAFSPSHSPTALIPSGFGIVILVLGIIARNEKARMHAMHGAALLGLIGFVMPAIMVIRKLSNGGEIDLAAGGQIAMSALCAIFLGLCVKSFIDTRIARKQREAQAAGK